jgi:RNA polymerase sigma-70 factor (ECF subfamily)
MTSTTPRHASRPPQSSSAPETANPLSTAEVSELYARHAERILRRSLQLLEDPSLALDARQQVFLKLMKRGAGVRDATSPDAWLQTLTTRCCIDLMRSRRCSSKGLSRLSSDEREYAPSYEQRSALSALLNRLTPRERRVAELVCRDGLTQAEVAAKLGCSRQSINKSVQAIRHLARDVAADC